MVALIMQTLLLVALAAAVTNYNQMAQREILHLQVQCKVLLAAMAFK
jgi:hypothetical protein